MLLFSSSNKCSTFTTSAIPFLTRVDCRNAYNYNCKHIIFTEPNASFAFANPVRFVVGCAWMDKMNGVGCLERGRGCGVEAGRESRGQTGINGIVRKTNPVFHDA